MNWALLFQRNTWLSTYCPLLIMLHTLPLTNILSISMHVFEHNHHSFAKMFALWLNHRESTRWSIHTHANLVLFLFLWFAIIYLVCGILFFLINLTFFCFRLISQDFLWQVKGKHNLDWIQYYKNAPDLYTSKQFWKRAWCFSQMLMLSNLLFACIFLLMFVLLLY